MASILCLDFDGVIVDCDITRALLERFAAPGWRDFETARHAGEISIEQSHQRAFDLVEATSDDLVAFVREGARPREGLLELTDWCHWHGWLVAAVSNGFDFAVNTVLDELKLDRVARHAGRTRFAYRWRVNYYSPRGVEVQDGFQLSYVTAFRSAGDTVALVGASATATAAARQAHVVFARDDLPERLGEAHPQVHVWGSLQEVLARLEQGS